MQWQGIDGVVETGLRPGLEISDSFPKGLSGKGKAVSCLLSA
jgi:hypothetical protein